MTQQRDIPLIFTPADEPYLGLEPVLWFDRMICWSMETNVATAQWTQQNSANLTALQRAACQIIPQGVSIALSIRELIRQAYLFSALILVRPLIERAAIVSYLDAHPEAISLWENGWKYQQRPSLATMLACMSGGGSVNEAQKICNTHNHMVHGDPVSSFSNLISLPKGNIGYSSGKMLNNPELCAEIALESYCYLIVLTGRITSIFPNVKVKARPTHEKGQCQPFSAYSQK